jgi:hypothetical protein
MLRKFSVLAIVMALISHAYAQDTTAPAKTGPTITGSADVYFRYGFNNVKESPYNSYTSFTTSQNSFELGMASVKLEHALGKAGVVIDLGFGRRAEDFSYNDGEGDSEVGKNGFFSMAMIKQLYLTYSPSDKVKFTFGSFGTHIGYELLDAYLNRNYSMSYGFSYGPFFHTGIKADFTLSGQSGLMVGVINPTDLKTASGLPKMFIGQFSTGTTDDKLNLYLNFQGGKSMEDARLYQGDVTASYAVNDKWGLGLNATYQTRSYKNGGGEWGDGNGWYGAALYVNADPTDWLGITLRGEYFNDEDDVLGAGIATSIFVPTLTFNFKVNNLTIMPEFRFDNAKDEIFLKEDGTGTKSSGAFILAAHYRF